MEPLQQAACVGWVGLVKVVLCPVYWTTPVGSGGLGRWAGGTVNSCPKKLTGTIMVAIWSGNPTQDVGKGVKKCWVK
jgi:hypothetical protein